MIEIEEKYNDYNWHMMCAKYWYKFIGIDPVAPRYWRGHLKFAKRIKETFK